MELKRWKANPALAVPVSTADFGRAPAFFFPLPETIYALLKCLQ